MRACGEIGRPEWLTLCRQQLSDDDPTCRFWAARSALLLGDRAESLQVLAKFASSSGRFQESALQLLIRMQPAAASREVLRGLARVASHERLTIKGVGAAGDSTLVPWLMRQMSANQTARLAGESFALITGLDPTQAPFDAATPKGFDAGPTDDPGDSRVEMDADEHLPWPNVEAAQEWWQQNGPRFKEGTCYFLGGPVNQERCRRALLEGWQRHRVAAAEHLALLTPGSGLFPLTAPAWRQSRLLVSAK